MSIPSPRVADIFPGNLQYPINHVSAILIFLIKRACVR